MSEFLNDNSLADAIGVLTQGEMSQYKADKTIEGVIFSVVNVVTGEYKVRYQDSVWSAFSQGKTKYKVGDNVLVKIPLGDFSGKKYIDGYIYNSDIDETNTANSIEEASSPDWGSIYQSDWSAEKGLIAYDGEEDHKSSLVLFDETQLKDSSLHNVFKQYTNRGTEFRITADFMTTFVNDHTKGNYGLRLLFETSKENESGGYEDVIYTFDSTQFNGNPYRTSSWTPQTILLTVPKRYLTKLKKIEFFQEGFSGYDPEGNTENANIFVRNLRIEWINVRDLTDYQYYLTIAAPQGFVFLDNIYPSLTLQAKLMSGAENLMDKSTCSCLWYVEDPSVLIDSNNYQKIAGVGWKQVEDKSFDTINVNRSEGSKTPSIKYKVIVIYNKENIFSEEITLIDLNSQYDLYLDLENDTYLTIKNRKKNENAPTLVGDWYVEVPDGSRTKVSTETKVTTQNVKDYFIYPWIKVYCDVYEGSTRIGTVEWTNFRTDEEEEEGNLPNFMLQYKGDDVFHYDANGDIFDLKEYDDIEHQLACTVTSAQSDALTFSIKWLDSAKQPISTDAGKTNNFDNSMMKSVWVDQNNVLRFKVKTKYYDTFINNSVYVRLTSLDGTFVDYEKEISFLKDGAQGTNGTSYVCLIRPIDSKGNKIIGENLGLNYIVNQETNGWDSKSSIKYKVFVYCNGELINNRTDKFKLSYSWEGCNVTLNKASDSRDVIEITPSPRGGTSRWRKTQDDVDPIKDDSQVNKTPLELNQFYIKCQVDIQVIETDKDGKVTNKGDATSVYAYQPIDIYVGNIDKNSAEFTAPDFIMYSAAGVNPQYDSEPLEFKYPNVETGEKEIGDITSLSDFLGTWEVGGRKYLLPATHFIGENNSVGTLQLAPKHQDSVENYILHSIFVYLNPYGNEAINSWDGTSINVDNDKHIILAPQVGAGSKNDQNQFSGVVMGKYFDQKDKTGLTGLYGYKKGINTFALMEDGKATFGGKQQITIDGDNAQITGKNGVEDNQRFLEINLADPNAKDENGNDTGKAADAIKIGSSISDPNFLVDYDGNLTANAGTIGGCNIENGTLKVGSANITSIQIGSNFKVDESGNMTASSGKFSGEVTIGGIPLFEMIDNAVTLKIPPDYISGLLSNAQIGVGSVMYNNQAIMNADGSWLTGSFSAGVSSPTVTVGNLVTITTADASSKTVTITNTGIILSDGSAYTWEQLVGSTSAAAIFG